MKKLLTSMLFITVVLTSMAQDTTFVFNPTIPIRIDREVNIISDIKISNDKHNSNLTAIHLNLDSDYTQFIDKVELYYTGTTSMLRSRTRSQALVYHVYNTASQTIYAHPSYAINISSRKMGGDKVNNNVTFNTNQELVYGDNYFYISVKLKKSFPLSGTFNINITDIQVDKQPTHLSFSGSHLPRRSAVAVRDAGCDGVHSYSIPALATAKNGDLLAVYDIRRNSSIDLQEDVQVGLSRSSDGGHSWQPMQTIIDMRETTSLPASQQGVGDPAITVDPQTGEIWVVALWTNGIGNDRAWTNVAQGSDPLKGAAQTVIVKSTDNGETWSKPYNITSQIKDSSWYIHLQGPGRGIVMNNGTLVFPYQFVDSLRVPHSTIIYSKDKGTTWHIGASAHPNTTEAQVIELPSGELMLNMRDNRGGSRNIMTTSNMGKTWHEHSSSRSALQEPVCMASLISLPNGILLFSNPNTKKGRTHITIKASTDNGVSWHDKHQVLLDSEPSWGYSCLTMIDENTIGILYESSVAQILFQTIPLKDLNL